MRLSPAKQAGKQRYQRHEAKSASLEHLLAVLSTSDTVPPLLELFAWLFCAKGVGVGGRSPASAQSIVCVACPKASINPCLAADDYPLAEFPRRLIECGEKCLL